MPSRIQAFRRDKISKPLLAKVQQILPPLSDTEQDALEAGTVGWDSELFSGSPSWNKLLSFPRTKLSSEETDFIDGPILFRTVNTEQYWASKFVIPSETFA